jgi:hypothetical protein
VNTPTRADKSRLQALGLDLTEHAGRDYVEVVLHSQADEDRLRAAGFTWDVRIADMFARQLERSPRQAASRRANAATPCRRPHRLPRARDFGQGDRRSWPPANPTLAKRSRSARASRVATSPASRSAATSRARGRRPVFLMFGAHHAREWPSAELPMEFAHDLVQAYTTARTPSTPA